MAANANIWKRLISAVFSEAAWQAFWTYLFPPLISVLTAVAGVVEHQPIMSIIAATAIVFAMTSFGLLAFSRWRFQRTPEHKIVFVRTIVNRASKGREKQVTLGFVMKSLAEFPLEIELTKMLTAVASRIPHGQLPLPRKMRVDAVCDFYFVAAPIDIQSVVDEFMSGEIEFEVRYGRPGGKKYTFSWAQLLSIPLDQKKPFSSSAKLIVGEQVGQGN